MLRRITNAFILLSAFRGGRLLACLAAAFVLMAGEGAWSQELEVRKNQSQDELKQLQEAISLSEERRSLLIGQIDDLDKDRTTINKALVETTKKSRELEKKIDSAGNRLSRLRDDQDNVRASLNSKKSLLAEVLGALQRMGRKPPPALLVTPEDALSSVRSAILLGSVIPEMRSETEILIGELRQLASISEDIRSEREGLTADLTLFAQEEERLNLLLEQKRQLASSITSDLAQESVKAAELAAQAGSLNELIANLETEIESSRAAAEAARKAEAERELREQERIAAAQKYKLEDSFSDPGRLAPAIAFNKTKGLLPLPVNGVAVSEFGENDGAGSANKGLSLEARENSRVISPADGWIVYAGPFRTYGQLLIINAGAGYHVVMAGMEDINVLPGQFVIVGEPVGKMGAQQVAGVGQIDVSTTKPILYVEFRKDGKSIDPAPWWAQTNLERKSNDS
ncbi:MAG: peptidoglycan DD-metalloendopeptidase family protein [Pseudomonadota bacterium]